MKSIIIRSILIGIGFGFFAIAQAQDTRTRTIYADPNHSTVKTETTTGTWTRQNPLYYLSAINQLFFINEQTGWSAGGMQFNEIHLTTDGARSWEIFRGPASIGNAASWQTVFFIDALNGWQAGGRYIIHTTDGGRNWSVQSNGLTDDGLITKIFFTDALHGWALDATGNVLATTNGGEVWHIYNVGYNMYLNDMCFVNSQTGWVVGYTYSNGSLIRKTTDGGLTWTPQDCTLSSSWNSISIINQYMVMIGGQDYLIKTTDGGATWNSITHQLSANFTSVKFFDERNGWCIDNTTNGRLKSTTNGGSTWADKTPPYASKVDQCFFISAQTGYAATFTGMFAKTTDGGTTWEYLASACNGNLWSLFPADNYFAWAAGQSEITVNTTNGGLKWNPLRVPDKNPAAFQDIVFADSKHGWMCYSKYGSIYKTVDGGNTWTDKRIVPNTVKALHDLVFLDALKGFAFGGNLVNRLIYKTIDGGETWTVPDYPAGDAIVHAYFLNESTGWAVCTEGTVLKTTNGGDNWTAYETLSEQWLESIWFIDQNHGFIVGERTILSTIDGGVTWVPIGEFEGWIEDICFMDAYRGIAVGAGFPSSGELSKTMNSDGNMSTSAGTAKIWMTDNGGDTWTEQVVDDLWWLLAVGSTDLNNAWASGNVGTILKYTGAVDIPEQPTGLEGVGLSANAIELTWTDNSLNESGFTVYRRTGLSGGFLPVATVGANTTTYTDTGFTSGETYWYRVAAINANGHSAQCLDISVKAPSTGLPDAVTIASSPALSLYPNPVRQTVTLDFTLVSPGEVSISLLDFTGAIIQTITNQSFAQGSHRLTTDLATLPSGIYIIMMQTTRGREAVRMVKL